MSFDISYGEFLGGLDEPWNRTSGMGQEQDVGPISTDLLSPLFRDEEELSRVAEPMYSSALADYFHAAVVNASVWSSLNSAHFDVGWAFALPGVTLAEREEAMMIIDSIKGLRDNWDGFGAAAVSDPIPNVARRLVSSLPDHIPTPAVSANPNGTISLEWQNDVGRAHLEIGAANFSCYVRRLHGKTIYHDGSVNEIDASKKSLLGTMYSVLPAQTYAISDISLAETP